MTNGEKNCPYCGEKIKEIAQKCPHCKSWLNQNRTIASENKLPNECKKFNWGAFFLTWIWGIGNRTYITFLIIPAALFSLFVPILGLAVSIWFGVQGNEWAWKNTNYNNAQIFNESQKKWAIFGTIIGILFSLIKIGIILLIFLLLVSSGVADQGYNDAMKTQACMEYEAIKNNPENLSLDDIIKYRDLKNECGVEILLGVIENLAK